MAVSGLVKRLQNLMRSDSGVDGDAQRIAQMVWLFFLKVYDSQESDWECDDPDYKSIIPEELRWRNWAPSKDEEGKTKQSLTGDELLDFVNNRLFLVLRGQDVTYEVPVLDGIDDEGKPIIKKEVRAIKGIKVDARTPRHKSIVRDVFMEAQNYMKNGSQLRKVVDEIDDIDLFDTDESHAFGDIYESILRDLQSAGNAGEFYTPRALTDFIIDRLNPQLGEVVGDFAMGTGGFLVSALKHLESKCVSTEDFEMYQRSIVGQEWKPFPYLLAVTNIMLHGIKNPDLRHMDSLGLPMSTYHSKGKVNVIAMNPPYGGSTDSSTKVNFKTEYRSSETTDLFMVLIMERLARGGRAGVVVPDGFLFGADGAKLAIKKRLLTEFNLHTIIRLPGSIFNPYTSIATNIVFFNNERAEGAKGECCTDKTWFYRLDMPEGYKNFSKTRPMEVKHCQPIAEWWNDRKEIVSEEQGEKSRCFSAEELIDMSCNFDQCKFPKEEEEVLPPDELLRQYHEKRNELDARIDSTLAEIQKLLGIEL